MKDDLETISADHYHRIMKPQDPRLSPDGERIAFIRQEPENDQEYEKTVYVVPVEGGEPEQYTIAEGNDSEPRWSPSGDRLAFVSTRGGEDDTPQLWVMPTSGGEARQVTNVVGGVSDIAWSPDGEKIAFTQMTDEKEREEGYDLGLDEDDEESEGKGNEEGEGDQNQEYEREEPDPRIIDRMIYRSMGRYLDRRRSHVYVVRLSESSGSSDTLSSEVTRLTHGDYDYQGPEWGTSNLLYYTVKRTEDPDDNIIHDIVEHDIDSDDTRTLTRTTAWQPSLAYSGKRLAYSYTPEEKASMRQTEIKVLDIETEDIHTPTQPVDRSVMQMVSPEWGPDDSLYFTTPDEGSYAIRRAPWDATDEDEIEIVVGEESEAEDFDNRDITQFDVVGDTVVYAQSEWDHPGDLFASNTDGEEERRLTQLNSSYLENRAVSQPEEVWYESDGVEVQGWVLTPPDFDESEEYPLVVEVHGGPHAMWSTSGTMWHEFQTLASRGYVVFWCNPRGSVGYGEEFEMAIERDWGGPDYDDIMTGVNLICERDYVDDDNLFVTGGSFGGFMTSWMIGQTDRFDGAVTQRGVHDLIGFYGSTDAFKLIEWDFDTLPWEEPEFLWEKSPTAHAHKVDTPTLVIHAENDFRAPINTAELFYIFLKKNDVDARFVRYPREGHELSRTGEPGHVVDRIERIARWFDGYSDHHDVPPALERGRDEGLSKSGD